MNHEEYLKAILRSKELELQETRNRFRVATAEFNLQCKMLNELIESIERQLEKKTP